MAEDSKNIENFIGVITEVSTDDTLTFIINQDSECQIGEIVSVISSEGIFVLAQVFQIKVDFYLEDARQFFVSKAVDNAVVKLSEKGKAPRYAKYISALILGHYTLSNEIFSEIQTKINKYTPRIFQKVYSLPFETTIELYGLTKSNCNTQNNTSALYLGQLCSSNNSDVKDITQLCFDFDIFKKHTLITGVTGSGKSRLAALIAGELALIGGHISILDPHSEYANLFTSENGYAIFNYSLQNQSKVLNSKKADTIFRPLSFYEKALTPGVLTQLMPGMTLAQEEVLYQVFDSESLTTYSTKALINNLLDHLQIELSNEYAKYASEINELKDKYKASKNLSEYIDRYISGVKKIVTHDRIGKGNRVSRVDVIIALLLKINELLSKELLSADAPNWLKESPKSIDIFNVDYSTTESIRRFVNSIIKYFLRQKSSDVLRLLIIDEAHMLLNDGSNTANLLRQLLREARKFNIAVMFLSQNLNDVSIDVRGQFQNQFMFREENLKITKHFPDRVCHVKMYGAKLGFAMRVRDIN